MDYFTPPWSWEKDEDIQHEMHFCNYCGREEIWEDMVMISQGDYACNDCYVELKNDNII